MKVEWTIIAQTRLLEIEEYIAQDSPLDAERFVDKLVARAEMLSENPLRGRIVPEAPSGDVREVFEGSYRIVYRIIRKKVFVLTVAEGHRLHRPEELE